LQIAGSQDRSEHTGAGLVPKKDNFGAKRGVFALKGTVNALFGQIGKSTVSWDYEQHLNRVDSGLANAVPPDRDPLLNFSAIIVLRFTSSLVIKVFIDPGDIGGNGQRPGTG
jgi:hypothetical protein